MVTSYRGKEAKIEISFKYPGKPVVEISDGAFDSYEEINCYT